MRPSFLSYSTRLAKGKYGGWAMLGEIAGRLDLECADVSALSDSTRHVASGKSGDVSPQSKTASGFHAPWKFARSVLECSSPLELCPRELP